MYIPTQFEETRPEVLQDLIRSSPLATLVTHSVAGLNANHIPMFLSSCPAPNGALQGHLARANPLVEEIAAGTEALAIFHGPEAYITPSWYATKKETGKVVPTWNYVVVHVHGVLRIVDDPVWLRKQLGSLTESNEAAFTDPWAISDAPSEHIETIMAAIVGMEMSITKMQGKWKVSQNQPEKNQASLSTGLRASGIKDAEVMAALVEARAKRTR